MQVMVIYSSWVNGEDKAEEVEFFEAEAASLAMVWVEASFFRYQSKSVIKSVMSDWYVVEISSTLSWVCTLQVMCLIIRAIEL